MDDAGLLEHARKGDEAAFSRLFARYQRVVYRYAVYMGGPEVGDDLVQETFLTVLRQHERTDPVRGSVLAYLLGIARRIALKQFAARGKGPFTAALEDEPVEPAAADWTVLDELTSAERVEAVRAAVHTLPAVYREVVVLCDLEEIDYATAADLMGCPLGTIRSRLHRARALLSAKLAALRPAYVGRGRDKDKAGGHDVGVGSGTRPRFVDVRSR